ncbi:MAG: NUDIX hydrolase [Proteobacteria bacterium]|nr:NUDIX hydrolase [Pseudomonadota bacterium]
MRILKIDKITDFRHLNIFDVSYLDRDGKTRSWQMVSRTPEPKLVGDRFDKPDGVAIVAYHPEKEKLVVVREFRIPLGGYQYSFPAGLMDEGESAEETCRRELKEETGLNVTRIKKMSPALFSSSGTSDESIVLASVECEGEPSNEGNESSEDIRVILLSPQEASRLCVEPKIKFNLRTWLILTAFAQTGRILI